jgi:hypothetical protein
MSTSADVGDIAVEQLQLPEVQRLQRDYHLQKVEPCFIFVNYYTC